MPFGFGRRKNVTDPGLYTAPRKFRSTEPIIIYGTEEERIRRGIREVLATIPNCTCEHTINAHQRHQKAGIKGFHGCGAVGCSCKVFVPDNQATIGQVARTLEATNIGLTETVAALNEELSKANAMVNRLTLELQNLSPVNQ